MSFRYEVRLSGEGGQGLVLAGKILAEAAAIYDNLNATQSQSYGPEARGGASRSEVIISDGDIDYPKAVNIDLMLALTQEAFNKYSHDVKKEGTIIVDSELVRNTETAPCKVLSIPILKIAKEEVGKAIVGNIVALGIICGIKRVITEEALFAAIEARVPKGSEEINIKAFKTGLAKALEYL